MAYHYAFSDFKKEHMSRAVGISLPISVKHSVEVLAYIKNKKIGQAKKLLDLAIAEKQAIPYKRFNQNLAHKTGIGPGRFPVKTAFEIKNLLESAESNAQFQGLNTSNLIVFHASAKKAAGAYHYGRKRRRKMKRATVEIVLSLIKSEKDAQEKKESSSKDHKNHDKKQKESKEQKSEATP
jgi:large subunit ribosomal protein L22